ncbi:MAG: hypothetical protein ACYC1I_10450 [Acidimicrobiales bacterium]
MNIATRDELDTLFCALAGTDSDAAHQLRDWSFTLTMEPTAV